MENSGVAVTARERATLNLARTEIEYLRRDYGYATDQLGRTDDAEAQALGLATYHRIFAPQAHIQVSRDGETLLHGRGPDAWADVARDALRDYAATQHLIGTQIVHFDAASFSTDGTQLQQGTAAMRSHVQATHIWPDARVRVVYGTYVDQVELLPDAGWQIVRMNLVYSSEEFRSGAAT